MRKVVTCFVVIAVLGALAGIGIVSSSDKADAQLFFANTRVGTVYYHHATVGTTAQDAIAAASVGGNLMTWAVCHDAESTATYLALSTAVDPLTDGMRIKAGDCHTCNNCSVKSLKDLNVVGQAAGTGYSVIQYRQ